MTLRPDEQGALEASLAGYRDLQHRLNARMDADREHHSVLGLWAMSGMCSYPHHSHYDYRLARTLAGAVAEVVELDDGVISGLFNQP